MVVHDPQPLPIIEHYPRLGPWIWRCRVDLTEPEPSAWAYLRPHIERYDAIILTLPEYRQELDTPQVFFMPAIDPFTIKNQALSDEDLFGRLHHYDIPPDLPLVVQVSRFDR